MNKLSKMYRSFFGINEAINIKSVDLTDSNVAQFMKNNPDKEINITEEDLEEAQLINKMTDYRGGIQYKLYDPAMAQNVAHEIKNFAEKKKIYTIKHSKSRNGLYGYFHFRLGDDPAKESQQLQGYISQKPEIKYFRFKVLGQKPKMQRRRRR